jgi:hypothetical protein
LREHTWTLRVVDLGLKKVLNVRMEDEYAGRRVNDMKHEFIAINL